MLDLTTSINSSQVIKEATIELSGEDTCSSFSGTITAVVNDCKVIHQEKIDVSLSNNPNYSTIHIMWETCGYKNYKSMGLFGSMTTRYQRVERNGEREFTIYGETYEITVAY